MSLDSQSPTTLVISENAPSGSSAAASSAEPQVITNVPSSVLQFAWDGSDLIVLDPVAARKIRRAKLSASTMKSITKCPARWAYESANRKVDEPFAATTLGTEMHSIYEHVYDESKVAPEDRDPDLFTQLIDDRAEKMWGDSTLPEGATAVQKRALAANKKKWIKETTARVMGILKIEDPKGVEVMKAHQKPNGQIVFAPEEGTKPITGIELAADNVKIAGIPFIGYIDRVRVDGYDEDGIPFLVPEDYKSSKRVPWLKPGDSDDDGDQIRLYAEIIRILTGFLPEEGVLLYTKVGKQRVVKITERSLAKAIARFVKANTIMDKTCSAGEFPADQTTFCGWCPLVDTCPTAIKNGVERASTNPTPVNLGIPTVRSLGARAPKTLTGDELPVVSPDSITVITRTAEDMKDGMGSLQVRPEEREAAEAAHAIEIAANASTPDPKNDPAPAQMSEVPTMMNSEKSAEADNEGAVMSAPEGFLSHIDKVPYAEMLDDNSLNPNSYASMAVFGLTELAIEKLVKEYGNGIGLGHIRALTAVFAKVVNRAFYEITGKRDGDRNVSIWQTGISTRIRGALRTVLTNYDDLPLLGGSDERWEDWTNKTVKRIVAIAKIAVETWEVDQTEIDEERPWDALVEKGSGKVEPSGASPSEAPAAPVAKASARRTSRPSTRKTTTGK